MNQVTLATSDSMDLRLKHEREINERLRQQIEALEEEIFWLLINHPKIALDNPRQSTIW